MKLQCYIRLLIMDCAVLHRSVNFGLCSVFFKFLIVDCAVLYQY